MEIGADNGTPVGSNSVLKCAICIHRIAGKNFITKTDNTDLYHTSGILIFSAPADKLKPR